MRKNIMTDAQARADYIAAVWALKMQPADDPQYSRYDWFVLWHAFTMMTLTPPSNPSSRNAAHSGPAFLPWHRYFLKRFEVELAQAIGKPDFTLPYWNWVEDGALDPNDQPNAPIWGADAMGGSGSPVQDGPFRFDTSNPTDPNNWVVRIELRPAGLALVQRGLERQISGALRRLPTGASVGAAIRRSVYDKPAWDRTSSQCFRNDLEGWRGDGMHNRVHGFIGGDMGFGHSPNDPIFFLHHCNCDRIWAYWQTREGAVNYAPDDTHPNSLMHHRPMDPCLTLPGDTGIAATNMDMFTDASATYDSFDDLALLTDVPVA